MSAIVSVSIDLTKIDKSRIVEKNCKKWLNLSINISDEANQYGQNVTVYHNQTKEERDDKENKLFLGNGSVIWNDGRIVSARKTENEQPKENNNLGWL